LSKHHEEEIMRRRVLGSLSASLLLAFSLASCATTKVPELKYPVALAVGADQRIYFADRDLGSLFRMDDIAGKGLVGYGTKGSGGPGRFLSLEGRVAFDSLGRIHIVDCKNAKVIRFDDMRGGNWTELSTAAYGLPYPAGVAVDREGRVYVTDIAVHAVARFDSMGGEGFVRLGERGKGEGQFSLPFAVAVDGDNRVYVADEMNGRIVRFDDMSGAGWTSLDGRGVPSDRGFVAPADIKLLPDGTILVADADGGRLFSFASMDGSGRRVFGWDGVGGRTMYPLGVGVDSSGRLYFTDNQAKQVIRVDGFDGAGLVGFPAP